MMTLRALHGLDEVRQLAPTWNELLARSASNSLFLTWEWICTWLEVYGSDFEPLVLVAEEQGEPRGIAPLMIRRGASAVAQLSRTLMFIGQEVDVAPDYLDFIVAPGLEPSVVPRFVGELTDRFGDRWDFIDLAAHLQSSPNRPHLRRSLWQAGIELRVVGEELAPYSELPGSWDEFLARGAAAFASSTRTSSTGCSGPERCAT